MSATGAPDMLRTTLAAFAERMAAACLELDPGTSRRLQALEGKVLRLDALLPDAVIYVHFTGKGMSFWQNYELEADAGLAGGPVSLLALLAGRIDPAMIDHEGIEIQGDSAFVAELISIFSALEIDVEEWVARLTGDIVAHELGKRFRASERWVRNALLEAERLNREYLDEELAVAGGREGNPALYQNIEAFAKVGDDILSGLNKLAQRK